MVSCAVSVIQRPFPASLRQWNEFSPTVLSSDDFISSLVCIQLYIFRFFFVQLVLL